MSSESLRETRIDTASKVKNYGLWTLQIFAAGVFLFAGLSKLVGQEWQIATFETVNVGRWLRYPTGMAEILGAALLLTRRHAGFGALLLAMMMVGAIVTNWFILTERADVPILLFIVLSLIAFGRRDRMILVVEHWWSPEEGAS